MKKNEFKILVACEESQRVCIAFRKLGFEAYSCDLQESSGGKPEWHIIDDAINQAYSNQYSMMIAHPPCTYFSRASCSVLFRGYQLNQERYSELLKSREFFMQLYDAPIQHICIENVVPVRIAELPQFTQSIQPYNFGHHYSKETRLWLKNLPQLKPTKRMLEFSPYIQATAYRYKNKKDIKRKGGDTIFKPAQGSKDRSKTFQGIANAMALQWGSFLNEKYNLQLNIQDNILEGN